jgi:undecaprenyl-diphosphatase
MPEATLVALAGWAGGRALPLFGAGLLLLEALALGLYHGVRSYGRPRDDVPLPPGGYLLLHFGLGFGLLVGAAHLFAELAEQLGDGALMGRLDVAFSDALAAATPPLALQAFALVTHLGDPPVLAALGVGVALLLLRHGRRWLAFAWATTLLGNALLNPALKRVFARARPLHEQALATADGFSFPSGHSSGSLVAWGMLAYLLLRLAPAHWHRSAVLAAVGLIYAIGCSRVFLRVHWPSDVLAGFASGAAWLAVCIGALEAGRHWRRNRRR